jgi:hypothetical protein
MTTGEAKFLDWAFLVLGAMLTCGGWRAIRKRRATAECREYAGKPALRLGWLWLVLGLLLILAAVTDITLLKSVGKIFMESNS